ncbi:MAG TPA: ferritin-like domain-containing protein [Kofleriaceae bacterium]|nr:ferritin-like domain-containing protein [Kofleriaceae bacterium]
MSRLPALPAPELAAFAPDQLRFAAAAWPMRAAEELRSALIYRALAAASRRALPAFAERFAAVMWEEIGHVRLCAAVGARLGAEPPRHDVQPVRERLAGLGDPRARTIALAVSEVAIGETISMSMFRESRRATTEPLSRAAIDSILADEARHHQLGWDALAALGPSEAMQREAAHALRGSEQQIALPALRFLEAGKPFDPAWAALGVIAPERRVEAFYAGVEQVVVPHLHRLGLDGGRAWAARYRAS